jgi:hypothetical protein
MKPLIVMLMPSVVSRVVASCLLEIAAEEKTLTPSLLSRNRKNLRKKQRIIYIQQPQRMTLIEQLSLINQHLSNSTAKC